MTAPSITIATYNILAKAYAAPNRYPNCAPSVLAPKGRLPTLIGRVIGLDADVLCIQECEEAVFARMGIEGGDCDAWLGKASFAHAAICQDQSVQHGLPRDQARDF